MTDYATNMTTAANPSVDGAIGIPWYQGPGIDYSNQMKVGGAPRTPLIGTIEPRPTTGLAFPRRA